MRLSIALPCYNEEQNIRATVEDIFSWFKEGGIDGDVVAVDDGSSDGTAKALQELTKEYPKLTVVTHEVNKGYGAAVRTGLDAAKGEWIAFMDSDGQFKAEDFKKLIAYTKDYSFITGRKYKRADPFIRKMNAKCFAILTYLTLGVWVRDINCAMKMMQRSIWKSIRPRYGLGALFNAETFFRLRQQGIPWKQVYVRHFPRQYGEQTGANLKVILRMFKDLVTLKRKYRKEEVGNRK